MCSVSSQNLKFLEVGGNFLLVCVVISLILGVNLFRFRLMRRSDDPFAYWSYLFGLLLQASFVPYPVHYC